MNRLTDTLYLYAKRKEIPGGAVIAFVTDKDNPDLDRMERSLTIVTKGKDEVKFEHALHDSKDGTTIFSAWAYSSSIPFIVGMWITALMTYSFDTRVMIVTDNIDPNLKNIIANVFSNKFMIRSDTCQRGTTTENSPIQHIIVDLDATFFESNMDVNTDRASFAGLTRYDDADDKLFDARLVRECYHKLKTRRTEPVVTPVAVPGGVGYDKA